MTPTSPTPSRSSFSSTDRPNLAHGTMRSRACRCPAGHRQPMSGHDSLSKIPLGFSLTMRYTSARRSQRRSVQHASPPAGGGWRSCRPPHEAAENQCPRTPRRRWPQCDRRHPAARTIASAIAISYNRLTASGLARVPCRTRIDSRQHWRRYSTSLAFATARQASRSSCSVGSVMTATCQPLEMQTPALVAGVLR